MPVIKVWCLPQMTEEQMNKLHKNIVQAVVGITELGLKDESDMTCLFPPDMMSYGLGEEIAIEVTGLFEGPGRTKTVGERLASALGETVCTIFPKAHVQCLVNEPNPEQVFWSSRM